jgi:hypothetical protein
MKKKKDEHLDLLFLSVVLNAILVLENLINLCLQIKR